jgi:hypothetical protein
MALGVVVGIGAGVAVGSKLNLGVSTSLQNLQKKASEGLEDISSAIKSKVSPNLADVKTSFPTKDIGGKENPLQKAKVQPVSKPKETKTQNLKTLESLSYFPSAMKYYIGFKIYNKVAENVLAKFKKEKIVDIYLPMPTNLVDSNELTYDSANLGPLGGAGRNLLQTSRETFNGEVTFKNISNIASKIGSDAITELGKTVVDLGAAVTLRGTGDVVGPVLRDAFRVSPNPFLATIFSNVNLRTHTFSYKFSPRSEDELFQLKEIVYNFRRAALPPSKNVGFSGSSYLLGFPYEVEIEFYPNKNVPYFFKPCVITSINFNYAPEGSPAFFKTGDPVAVEFTINLQELEVITREDVENNSDADFGRARSLGLVDASGQSTFAEPTVNAEVYQRLNPEAVPI